jgi:hypothetical protein
VAAILKGRHVLVEGLPEDTNKLHLKPVVVDRPRQRP